MRRLFHDLLLVSELTVQDLLDMNALFRRLIKDALVITIFPIPLARLMGLMFTDASLANRNDCATQCAYIACMTDVAILDGNSYRIWGRANTAGVYVPFENPSP